MDFLERVPKMPELDGHDELVMWAKRVVANPARHQATEREAVIVADLLAELDREATR
jgi:hypothetical protein